MATRILVVDDEDIIRKTIIEQLKSVGCEVAASVGTAEDALIKAKELRPDLVLMDIVMPGEADGISCAEEIRLRYDIPVIFLTGYSDQQFLERAKITEPYGYILKPFDDRDLRSAVEMALYKHAMERRIRVSEEKYRTLVETANECIITLDSNGVFLFMNSAAAGLLNGCPAHFIGKTVFDVFPQHIAVMIINYVDRVIGGVVGCVAEEEIEISGKRGWYRLNVQPFKGPKNDSRAVLVMAYDITPNKTAELELAESCRKLKEAQEQLVLTGKMNAMGLLAAGVSHELNQPLTGIRGFAQAALEETGKDNRISDNLVTIIQQCNRMENIIDGVQSFARKSPLTIERVNVNHVIEEMLGMMRSRLCAHNIKLFFSPAAGLPDVMGNANQLQQVFINLLANAADAIESCKRSSGGTITIASMVNGDGNMEIRFNDDGCGISKEYTEKIFSPFFTTKRPEGGTGLGLSIAYGIIENHNGMIFVESAVGAGATFRVVLPVAQAEKT
jgi:two-component system, cell cycle sensor histidine kinase and response regulator CckA